MKVEQIYEVMNDVTQEVLGETAVVNEDLSNIVDIGVQLTDQNNIDNYVRSLPDHIGKVVMVDRPYEGGAPSVMMDGWEYGSILEKVTYENLPEATENESWELTDGAVYEQDTFYKPEVSAKFFNKRTTFEIPMSFAYRQVKSAFDSVTQLNSFFSMIETAIRTSLTVKNEALVERTINNMISETLADVTGVRAVNLLALYNDRFSEDLTADKAIYTPEFIRFAAFHMGLVSDRIAKISTLFNAGGKVRHTPKSRQHFVMLSGFAAAADTYLQADVWHNEYTKMPTAERVAYWQGSGTDFALSSTSAIDVKNASGNTVQQDGILAVLFDRFALGVTNMNQRVTSHNNAKAEFYNNWYKVDAGYFNDMNENFVVFYVADETT